MFLAIDIGNTNINLGVFHNKRLLKKYAIPTECLDYYPGIKRILRAHSIDDIAVCSVVPASTRRLTAALSKLSKRKALIIGKDITVPIKNLYRKPGQVGQDRLVSAYAGVKLYGAPLIIIDLGTAITFDAVSKNSEYLGGMIFPGLNISLEALFERTALLPKVALEKPKEFIGRDTINSIRSGIVFGCAALISDFCKKIRLKIGKDAKIIGTGGNIELLSGYCRCFTKINKNLVLEGINLIRQKGGRT